MKIVHLSDLHLGKWVNGFSMLEDQKYILDQILSVIESEQPEAVLISGDIYDRSVPPAEAVQLFDGFLVGLAERGTEVFIISGNHDSAERLAFGGRLMEGSGVHFSPVYDGNVQSVLFTDAWGEVMIYMLPFVKPAHVRRWLGTETGSCTEAVAAAISRMEIDPQRRNVLMTHQFVTGAERSESEDVSVGGTDNVDASVFFPFDYVALGHIHGPQFVERETIRYCGTPLKYSFSEKDHKKSVTVAELRKKGNIILHTVPLTPLHDLREIRGSYEELTLRKNYERTDVDDYIHAILTDEEDVPDAAARLRLIYPNLMKLDYDNTRTRTSAYITEGAALRPRSERELFAEFYEKRNGRPMNEEQEKMVSVLLDEIREEMA